MVLVDFSPGTHGHFLSYIVNQYIFDIQAPVENIFQSSGAAHFINIDQDYLNKKMVDHGHYSYFDLSYPKNTSKIIWIKHDPKFDFLLLTNIYYRCHPDAVEGTDVNINEIKKLHLDSMFSEEFCKEKLRENWYTKLIENHLLDHCKFKNTEHSVFKFDYRSFFSLPEFIEELRKCADFCEMKLNFKKSLVELHQKFLEINQGYQQWVLGNQIVESIIANKSFEIDPDNWQVQSYINYRISKIFKIYDGLMFDSATYPANAQDIHKIVLNFIAEYDKKF